MAGISTKVSRAEVSAYPCGIFFGHVLLFAEQHANHAPALLGRELFSASAADVMNFLKSKEEIGAHSLNENEVRYRVGLLAAQLTRFLVPLWGLDCSGLPPKGGAIGGNRR